MQPFEVKGKYNTANVYAETVDNETISQIIYLMNQKSIKDSKVRIMSDCHSGAGCVIGTTMTIKDKVIPNIVGVDIGCGMHIANLKEQRIEFPKLDSVIRKHVPAGFEINESEHKYCRHLRLDELRCVKNVYMDKALKSLGTLGGGNHFIEVDTSESGEKYLVVHTGSRHLGKQIAEYYQDRAYKQLNVVNRKEVIKAKVEELTKAGRQREIEKALEEIKKTTPVIPYELAYCEGKLFEDYIHDMQIAQEYAYWNRRAIIDTIVKNMRWHIKDEFETIHNYIDIEHMILRKGAVSAQNGQIIYIPINMRDGGLICIGKGNEEWNCSAPHGAGRLMSRSKAKESLSMEKYRNDMKEAGIYTTSVNTATLDECADAYKPMDEILRCINDTIEVSEVIKPVYNFKCSNDSEPIWIKEKRNKA